VFDVATGKQSDLTDDHVSGGLLGNAKNQAPAYFDSTPTWSPAGDAIYFARTVVVGGHTTPSTAIYRIPAAGGRPNLVVDAAPDQAFALWSGMALAASGKKIVFTLDYINLNNKSSGLYVSDLPGTGARKVVPGNPKFGPPFLLGLTPDGSTALVWYYGGASQFASPPHASFIFLANLKTGALRAVTPVRAPASGMLSQNGAVLSPDGTKLLYLYRTVSGQTWIVIRTLRSGAETTLSFAGEQAAKPIGVIRIGWGMSWAANDTIYIATQTNAGVLLTLHR
jgi:Tol biopolymer transport system component